MADQKKQKEQESPQTAGDDSKKVEMVIKPGSRKVYMIGHYGGYLYPGMEPTLPDELADELIKSNQAKEI